MLGKVLGGPSRSEGGRHQLPVRDCAWSVKNVSQGKGLPTGSCQWVVPSLQTSKEGRHGGRAVCLGLVLASVCTSLSQCPQGAAVR